MASTEQRFTQLSQTRSARETTVEAITGQSNAGGESSQIGEERTDPVLPPVDMSSLLKTLRVDVPRFDDSNVDNWIYRINKFFSLHQIDPRTLLAVVEFHLMGSIRCGINGWRRAAPLQAGLCFSMN